MKSELPESWFSNPRPLPLDERGRVDFSRDKRMVNTQPVQPNPTTAERFIGRMFHAVSLPDRGRIIQLYRWDESDRDLPLATANHNVFRLDAAGKVVWQVRRELGLPQQGSPGGRPWLRRLLRSIQSTLPIGLLRTGSCRRRKLLLATRLQGVSQHSLVGLSAGH